MQFQSVSLALITGVLNTVPQVRFPHSVGKIVVAIGLDDIGDFSSLGLFCRADAMPAIDDFVVLINLNRRAARRRYRRIASIKIVVALAKPGVQVIPEYDVVEGDHLRSIHSAIVA